MMRQIADERAPFATVDEALAIGKLHLDAEIRGGGSPVGMVAEEQAGGYFVRIAWTVDIRRTRHSRRRLQHHAAEVGRLPDAE